MSYTITKTNGVTIGTILDGTIDNTTTSLTLIGRNYSNYGQLMVDNLVSLLENFAYSTAPSNPLAGQLWWNTSDLRLRVWTGSAFKVISACTAQSTGPVTTSAGDLWWDDSEDQLYVYNGTSPYDLSGWILVGPSFKRSKGKSGAIWEVITDTSSAPHDVVSLYLDGIRTAIISQDSEFIPLPAIAGFSRIRPGLTSSTNYSSGTYWITANNSSFVGGLSSSQFLRSDDDDTTTGSLTIANNTGLTLGQSGNLVIATQTTGNVSFTATKTNADINFYTSISGTSTRVLEIDGATGRVTVKTLSLQDTTSSTSSSTGALVIGGGVGVAENLNVAGTGTFTGNLYAPTQTFGTSDTTVATTEFVTSGLSGLLKNKIYDSANTYIDVNDPGTGNARVVIDGAVVATASASGFNLADGAVAVTQSQTYNGSGDAKVATTQYVKTATTWWGNASHRSAKWVSTEEPNPGVNDIGSNDGDFWFQREL